MKKQFILGLLMLAITVIAFVFNPIAGIGATLAMAGAAATDPNDPEFIRVEAEKLEAKMNKLVDPLIAKLAKLEDRKSTRLNSSH